MNRIVAILLSIVTMSSFGFGQKASSCKERVLKYNSKMSKIGKPSEGKVYFMDYRQQMSYWNASAKPLDTRVKYYVSDKKSAVISNEMKIFMDEDFMFTVLESQKKIILTLNPQKAADPTSIKRFLKNQEYVVRECEILQCSLDESKGIRKVVLDANNVDLEGLKADKLTYFFKEGSTDLMKTITTYDRSYPVRRMSMTINTMNFNSSYKFPKNLYSSFLDSNGKLRPKYKGYQLITE